MTAQFQVGRTYQVRSICDYECIFSFVILSRTEKTVSIRAHNNVRRRKIRLVDGVECIDPFGRYSMSPVLRAAAQA